MVLRAVYVWWWADQSGQAPHDETGERMFTIMGSAKANESALFLLYENLEAEKMRRSQMNASE